MTMEAGYSSETS